jgi:uncharacterized membrane protein
MHYDTFIKFDSFLVLTTIHEYKSFVHCDTITLIDSLIIAHFHNMLPSGDVIQSYSIILSLIVNHSFSLILS